MKYFGTFNHSGICDELQRIDAPTHAPCGHCGELIGRADNGFAIPSLGEPLLVPFHRECFLRGIFGSVAHQQKRCRCFGGTEEDHPSLTVRAAAKAACEYFERRN